MVLIRKALVIQTIWICKREGRKESDGRQGQVNVIGSRHRTDRACEKGCFPRRRYRRWLRLAEKRGCCWVLLYAAGRVSCLVSSTRP